MAVGGIPQSFQDALEHSETRSHPLSDNASPESSAPRMQEPQVNDHNPCSALSYLFEVAARRPEAMALCKAIKLPMVPPLEQGVVTYLLRLEAIGQLDQWPLLFGDNNEFVLYLLDKITNNRFLPSELEVYQERRLDTAKWRVSLGQK